MKWNTKTRPPYPRTGDRRIIKEFVWRTPRECSDGTTRWLETVELLQEYTIVPWDSSYWKVIEVLPVKKSGRVDVLRA